MGHLSWARKKGDKEFLEGKVVFFAHPLRGLNEILDPSKATSARPRKLGLPDFVGTGRPQTVRVRPAGRYLRPRRVPQNFVGPLRGRAGFGVKLRIEVTFMVPMRKFSQATESEGEAFRTV